MRPGVPAVAFLLALTACGSSSQSASRADVQSASEEATPTATVLPSASASSTAGGEWPFVMTACDGASDEPLLLVALGTSETAGANLGGAGVAPPAEAYPGQYAGLLCEELGVAVELHSYYPGDLGPLAWWRERIATDDALRTDLEHAQVVAVWVLASHDVVPTFFFGTCTGDWPGPLKECIERTVAPIPGLVDEVYGAIEDLVSDDALVLAADGFTPPAVLNRWGDEPYWAELHATLDPAAITATTARAHGFTVVPTEVALNGETRVARLDPSLIQGDGVHLTREGQAVVAAAFAAADGLGD
jgi:hypothetical protein